MDDGQIMKNAMTRVLFYANPASWMSSEVTQYTGYSQLDLDGQLAGCDFCLTVLTASNSVGQTRLCMAHLHDAQYYPYHP